MYFIDSLKIDPECVNVNGGAIAYGHPLGATGVMILSSLIDELERKDLKLGVATLCTASGMAASVLIERV